jgi:ribonuclease T2
MSSAFARAIAAASAVVTVLGLFAALATGDAMAQERQQNEPGQFDFYMLVLSWSPSFCAENAERGRGRYGRSNPQCGARPYSFVVHGLWPQFEHGFPEACQVPSPRLYRGIVNSMLDLMPAPALIYHEWDRHGTCSGLSADAYFETIRKARTEVKIPPEFTDLQAPLTVSPGEVEDAFIKANPGLTREGISVSCGSRRLDEIRICMSRDLQFRACDEVSRRSCKRDKLVMPPTRGG